MCRHAEVQLSGRFGSNPPFLSRSVESQGDQSRFKSLGLYTNVKRSRYDCWELCNPATLKAVSPILYETYNDPQWGLPPMSGSAADIKIGARVLSGNYTPPTAQRKP
jgi:hypothetical protein